ncbi:MAG: response regulator transcription factor [Dehalococcoidales bacterium]|nr:response regulator transcription factor [Dehalococcoidales bacterium]
MKQFRVLVVDDEPRILNFLEIRLKTSGYEVLTADSGLEALEQVQAQEPDLLVLDVVMPGIDGFETLKQIRALSSVPVIILSGREGNTDKIKGLDMGADDYLVKPFNPDELVARIEAVRRRLALDRDRTVIDFITLGNISVNLKNHLVVVDGKEIPLTRIEWLLLSELARNAGKLMMYEELLIKIWGPEYRDDVQILRTWISRIRRKIEPDPAQPAVIRTIPKTGYIIDHPSA